MNSWAISVSVIAVGRLRSFYTRDWSPIIDIDPPLRAGTGRNRSLSPVVKLTRWEPAHVSGSDEIAVERLRFA